MTDTTAERLNRWYMRGKTGLSSETIAKKMMGYPLGRPSHPYDGGDFARCEGLLDAVPEFRARLGEMAGISPYWAALVPRWEDIRRAPDKYKLMRSILDPIEKTDRGVVRLGPGVTMRFGR
jgi:hypothetical protein